MLHTSYNPMEQKLKKRNRYIAVTDTHKSCSICREMLLKSAFHKSTRAKYGLDARCTKCLMVRREQRFAENPDLYFKKLARDVAFSRKNKEKARSKRMVRLYGITLEEYKEMYKSQAGCCAICERPESDFKKTLSVDHCHKTKTVRALLCIDCNTVLGRFKDEESLFHKSIEYLRRYNVN